MEALATVTELNTRFPISSDLEAEAAGALMDLSEDARYYGSDSWVDEGSTPQSVNKLILRAAARHMKNVDGFIESRAGDETVQWNKDAEQFQTPGTASFTSEEKARLREYGGGSHDQALWSVDTYATPSRQRRNTRNRRYGPGRNRDFDYDLADGDYVPVEGGGDPFPYPDPDWSA